MRIQSMLMAVTCFETPSFDRVSVYISTNPPRSFVQGRLLLRCLSHSELPFFSSAPDEHFL